jgi:hypothetical protein
MHPYTRQWASSFCRPSNDDAEDDAEQDQPEDEDVILPDQDHSGDYEPTANERRESSAPESTRVFRNRTIPIPSTGAPTSTHYTQPNQNGNNDIQLVVSGSRVAAPSSGQNSNNDNVDMQDLTNPGNVPGVQDQEMYDTIPPVAGPSNASGSGSSG